MTLVRDKHPRRKLIRRNSPHQGPCGVDHGYVDPPDGRGVSIAAPETRNLSIWDTQIAQECNFPLIKQGGRGHQHKELCRRSALRDSFREQQTEIGLPAPCDNLSDSAASTPKPGVGCLNLPAPRWVSELPHVCLSSK